MKVIHFLHELKFSGAEIMYVDAAPVIKSILGGGKFLVVNTAANLGEYAPYFERAGYEVLHWPYPKSYLGRWRWYAKVIRYLRQEHIDVVHIHSSGLKWGASYCAWRVGCRAVYTFHNVFHSHWYSWPLHWWLRWCAKHIFGCRFQTISDSVYDNELHYYFNRTTKVYNWYGSSRFYPADEGEKGAVRAQLGLPAEALVIVSVGGCSHIKRHHDVLRALPAIIEAHPHAVYLHLGEGATLAEEQALATELGVAEHVRFCGNQTDVRRFLIASDIYVMPSRHEGISITTIEAMACGIPAVLYDVPGLRDFNVGEERSVLIPESVEALAEAIISLYADSERQVLLAARAKVFVDEHFRMETNAARIVEMYKS